MEGGGRDSVAGCCHTCQLTTRVAVVMATSILVIGLLMGLVLFVTWTRAPEVDQTAKTSSHELMERLQQCQRERQEVNLMLHTVTQDPRCSVCPDGWLWWGGHCYFFSVGQQDDRSWIESSEFCLQLNSSLAVIRDPAEMEFIQGVMRRFPLFPFLWVGLTDAQQEGLWLWGDGGDVQQYMPVTVEWDAEDRDCADLRGGGSLFASSCEAYGPWACKRGS
ncbi:C-type lectin domain family 12 member B-like isoform X2 [Trematomus bernacchii]|uniref:C-type lectin domain family 12 member B-like isoform X2 n=1 Tax=Trematomus bernacchii TaxID=40690 RepID=UPI00146AFDCA|nr:C-type lectin domain family 12 member B-like isoform X2 [Trematomus bernacchii]